jgi:hypothetical protein
MQKESFGVYVKCRGWEKLALCDAAWIGVGLGNPASGTGCVCTPRCLAWTAARLSPVSA